MNLLSPLLISEIAMVWMPSIQFSEQLFEVPSKLPSMPNLSTLKYIKRIFFLKAALKFHFPLAHIPLSRLESRTDLHRKNFLLMLVQMLFFHLLDQLSRDSSPEAFLDYYICTKSSHSMLLAFWEGIWKTAQYLSQSVADTKSSSGPELPSSVF